MTARPSPPPPPMIDQSIARLVRPDSALIELFMRMAKQNSMLVETVGADQLSSKLIEFLKAHRCSRVALADGVLPLEPLQHAGLGVRLSSRIMPEEPYDIDCGITDVHCAIAETGSLVIRGSAQHCRALSLVPPIHVAIVWTQQILPDLLDLFEMLARDPQPANIVIITGPSKTADIEMNLVTGVHGPGVVQVFILQ